MQVTLQYVDGCPHWQAVDRRLRALAGELGFALDQQRIDTPEAAETHRFRGSPTIPIDGRDPFASGDEPVGLSCRVYATSDGPAEARTTEQLQAVLKR